MLYMIRIFFTMNSLFLHFVFLLTFQRTISPYQWLCQWIRTDKQWDCPPPQTKQGMKLSAKTAINSFILHKYWCCSTLHLAFLKIAGCQLSKILNNTMILLTMGQTTISLTTTTSITSFLICIAPHQLLTKHGVKCIFHPTPL